MEGNEINCLKCKQPAADKDVYTCDSCLSKIHKRCVDLSASEERCMPLQKRMLMLICEECRRMLAKMPYMVKMLENIQDEIQKLKETHPTVSNDTSEISYSEVLKLKNMSQNSKAPNPPAVIIKPKKVQNIAKTKNDVHRGINPTELNIGIKHFKTTKGGSVVIKCTNKQESERLKQAAEGSLRDGYTVETLKMKLPRVKIASYTGDKSIDEIEESILKQNSWITSSDTFKVTYIKKIKNKNTSTVFVECAAGLYAKMMALKKVYIDWERCPVYEDLSVTRCFNCQGYNHKSASCDRRKVCGRCAGEHDGATCQSPHLKCVNCATANDRFGMQYAIDHSSSDPQCPSTNYHTEIIRSRTDYGS